MLRATQNFAQTPPHVLQMQDIAKAYGATIAVRRVSLDITPGEVHAVLGENGAGKSTIVKILSGIVAPDSGILKLNGAPFAPKDPMAARVAGISTAFQELSLLPNLTVAENLALPRQVAGPLGLVSRRRGVERAAATLAAYGLAHIHPALQLGTLSLAEKQRIEIARAISRNPQLLVLDEPTAALADPEWLFSILERVTQQGTGVLYISHRLAEVRRLCRRGTILRNGESIETISLEGVDDSQIFEMMVGSQARSQTLVRTPESPDRPVALSIRGLSGGNVDAVGFDVRKGEIVGVAGLEGQGQRDLFRMLAGLVPATAGQVSIDGNSVALTSPAAAARAGIGFVPEERKTEGLFLGLGTDKNISVSVFDKLSRLGVVDRARERSFVADEARRVDLAERYLRLPIGQLSGGNQQKALIGRVLASGARNLILFDPTRGVDVGTKALIYEVIRSFVRHGGAVLVYSTELSELVHLVNRCLVIYRGRIVGEVSGSDLSEQKLVALAAGHGADA